jgi:NADPH-dependent 2,4-dienoyl-CoA reductase/sulfur reductase-like enzyme/rhodanese-related sulfurtransferase
MGSGSADRSSGELRIVIVGGVAAGASAATRARRMNERAHITMLEKDAYVSFANCGLPYYVGGEIADRDKLLVASEDLFRQRFNIDVRSRCEVVRIDREEKTVHARDLVSGDVETLPYDKLILATGAEPIIPPLTGVDAPNVFVMRSLEDADRLKAGLDRERPTSAVVVGAGYIGIEVAEQLVNRGIDVTIVEKLPEVMSVLDREMGSMVRDELERRGVRVVTGDALVGFAIGGDGRVTHAETESGDRIAAPVVVMGIGVRPATGLAREAGLTLRPDGAVPVDDFMRTSDPSIYAAGDNVAYPHVSGEAMRVALGGPANRAGRIAGEHAATGRAAPMRPVAGTAVVRAFGVTAAMTGLTEQLAERLGREHRAVHIVANHHAGYFPGAEQMVLKLVYEPSTRAVLGAQAVGGAGVDKRIDVIATALCMGGTVDDLAGLDLAYAPPFGSAKDPVHMAAFVAQNDLDGVDEIHEATDDFASDAQLLDVRTPAELQRSRLPGATHIELESLRQQLGELDAQRPTIVMCHTGVRAHVAARILAQRGFRGVKNLSGGMLMRRTTRPDDVINNEEAMASA